MTNNEVIAYARVHQLALEFLNTATHDYSAARCLLYNGLADGLILGAQAIEKYLKAFILLHNPTKNVRQLNHRLPGLLLDIEQSITEIKAMSQMATAELFEEFYQFRYPDNLHRPQGLDTGERLKLDEFLIGIHDWIPCPRNVKFRTGLHSAITSTLERRPMYVAPSEFWLKINNAPLAARWPSIEETYPIVMAELYPSARINPQP